MPVESSNKKTTRTAKAGAKRTAKASGSRPSNGGDKASNGRSAARQSRDAGGANKKGSAPKLTGEQLLSCYRTMVLSRTLDEKCALLLKQSKGGTFQIVGPGQEAIQAAAALVMRGGTDWSYCHYRDQCYALGLGLTAKDILLAFLAREGDPASGARQMPSHFGHRPNRIVTKSSCVGTQYLQAAGAGLVCHYEGKGEVVYCSSGEGTTSEGEFYEALNFAALHKSAVVFLVQDNGYAISTPRSEETASPSIYEQVAGFGGLHRIRCDGLDVEASYAAMREAHGRAACGDGPTLIQADVLRLWPHSSSDNHLLYRTKEEIAEEAKHDPIAKLAALLVERGHATKDELGKIATGLKAEVDKAANEVEEAPFPSDAISQVYFEGRHTITDRGAVEPKTSGEPEVMIDLINRAHKEEMRRDPRIVVFGQDVAKDKGGVFTATKGLTAEFGARRCFNSPLAEATVAGVACGMAHAGWRPLVEIQFGDYIFPAFQQIVNEIATCRYRSNGNWANPMVIRTPVGGYIQGAMYHSQSIDGLFAHRPGLRIAIPSRADDAKGLLKAAIRGEDPVLFLEPKFLYRQSRAKAPDPGEDYVLPFGKLRVVQPGSDVTLVTWGNTVLKALDAAAEVNKTLGASIEILDLRTLSPWDKDSVLASVGKTSRCVIVHEDFMTGGFGAEISARIMEEAFDLLDAPVLRVAAKDCYCPYAKPLEDQVLPQTAWVVEALTRVLRY